MEYFKDDYKDDVGDEGYATEDTDGDTSTLSVEDVIEAKIKKNEKLFPTPPPTKNRVNVAEIEKEVELTDQSQGKDEEEGGETERGLVGDDGEEEKEN